MKSKSQAVRRKALIKRPPIYLMGGKSSKNIKDYAYENNCRNNNCRDNNLWSNDMFIGRKEELAKLERHYDSGEFEFAVIDGRRRIGKTTLISEFVKDKATIFFTGMQENANSNLKYLSQAVLKFENPTSTGTASFPSFNDLLEEVGKIAAKQRVVWIIDEYPYLAESYPGFSSLLQKFIDRVFLKTKLFLILCGS